MILALTTATALTLCACAPTQHPIAAEIETIYAQDGSTSDPRRDAQQLRDEAVLRWAAELGVAPGFSAQELQLAHDDPAAGSGYGPREPNLWEFYRDHVEAQSQLIRDRLRAELTIDDVREFYDRHPDRFQRQDEMTIEITEWEGTRAVGTHVVELDEHSVRAAQEQDDAVIAAALELEEGGQTTVDRGDGRYAQVRCLSRAGVGAAPFDDVVQAAAAQFAAAIFEAELADRMQALDEHS